MATPHLTELELLPVESSATAPESAYRPTARMRRVAITDDGAADAAASGAESAPVQSSSGEALPAEVGSPNSTPRSALRPSPRALALAAEHQPILSATRLTRKALLAGDWFIVDVFRRDTELRALIKSGEAVITQREQEILEGVLAGMPDRELSRQLGITRQCVCGHLGNVVTKLGAESRFTVLEAWRVLAEAERGRAGRAQLAEVRYGDDTLLSVTVQVPPRPEIEARLSSAETNVAWLVCDGLSNRDIAIERGTAERTVANQVASIFQKLGVSRRFDVAQFLLGF